MAQDTDELDQERTTRIRQMLAEQNPEMVQQRYGEDVTGTPEYQEAEQRLQREQQKRRRRCGGVVIRSHPLVTR